MSKEEILQSINKVVDLYMERFPLEPHYGIHLCSSEDDSQATYYYRMSEEELALIREWQKTAKDQYLIDFLEEKGGYDKLIEKWLQHDSPYPLDTIDFCDLEHPMFFTKVRVRQLNDNGELWPEQSMGMPITTAEMKDLLSAYLRAENELSVNQLTSLMPEFVAHMMEHISWALLDNVCQSSRPFIIEMTEIKKCVNDILDPKIDILGLYQNV